MKKSEISKNIWRSKVASRFPFSIFIFYLAVLFLGLQSCNNFLEGGDFKEQLKKDVDYANAAECTLI
ncbi:MAG: hypothetical protein IKP49_05085, partial [Treponema sp.]|nr:hypothetical protein [Treponema sp.]